MRRQTRIYGRVRAHTSNRARAMWRLGAAIFLVIPVFSFWIHLTFCRWSQFSRGKHTHAALGSLPGGCEPCMNAQIRPPAQGTTAHTHSQHTLHSKTSARLLPRAHRSRTGVCRAIGHTDAHLKHAHACLRLHAVANRQEGQHLLATH